MPKNSWTVIALVIAALVLVAFFASFDAVRPLLEMVMRLFAGIFLRTLVVGALCLAAGLGIGYYIGVTDQSPLGRKLTRWHLGRRLRGSQF